MIVNRSILDFRLECSFWGTLDPNSGFEMISVRLYVTELFKKKTHTNHMSFGSTYKINNFKINPYLRKKRKIIISFCTERLQQILLLMETVSIFFSPIRFGMQPVPQKWAVLIVYIQCCLQTLTVVSKLMTTL